MSPTEVPQMVVITFDDAVNDENWKLYTEKLFPAAAKNPNGCPIHGTFYVSHEYTNYAMVKYLKFCNCFYMVHSCFSFFGEGGFKYTLLGLESFVEVYTLHPKMEKSEQF